MYSTQCWKLTVTDASKDRKTVVGVFECQRSTSSTSKNKLGPPIVTKLTSDFVWQRFEIKKNNTYNPMYKSNWGDGDFGYDEVVVRIFFLESKRTPFFIYFHYHMPWRSRETLVFLYLIMQYVLVVES